MAKPIHNMPNRVPAIATLCLAGGLLLGCQQRADEPPLPPVSSPLASHGVPQDIQQIAEQVAYRAIEIGYIPLDPAIGATCARSNATSTELLALSDMALNGITRREHNLVGVILRRDMTTQCLIENGEAPV